MEILRKAEIICVLALVCWMLAGCTKGGLQPGGGGIEFTAATSGETTRTAYSGAGYDASDHETTEADGLLAKERLDWVLYDQFTVWCNDAEHLKYPSRHWADYMVKTIQTVDVLYSRAKVIATDGNGLQWGTASNYTFYARYPADGTKINGTAMSATIPSQWNATDSPVMAFETETKTVGSVTTRRIVGKPDMDYAFMFATATASNTSDPVRLDFIPEFTAFQFTVDKGNNEEINLTSFKMETLISDASIAGDFTLTYKVGTETNVISIGSGSPSITVDFRNPSTGDPLTLDSTTPSLTFTVFALPVDMTSMKITFEGTEIGKRTLLLNYGTTTTISDVTPGSPIVFDARKKHRLYGLHFPDLLSAHGESLLWDQDIFGENIIWDN